MTYGNLAYKYDYITEKQNIEKPDDKTEVKKAVPKSKPISYAAKLLSVVVLTISAIFMIAQFVEVNETQADLSEARSQYEFEEAVTAQKAFELEQSIDLSKIEQEATNRLGMHRPDRHQIIYIDVPQDDVTEKTADEVEGFKNRFSGAVKSIMSNIVEFFSI